MVEFRVQGMTCGGCAARVKRAIQGVADDAQVEVDLPSKTVRVQTSADAQVVTSAVASAGYPVTAKTAAA